MKHVRIAMIAHHLEGGHVTQRWQQAGVHCCKSKVQLSPCDGVCVLTFSQVASADKCLIVNRCLTNKHSSGCELRQVGYHRCQRV
jgi:hypothetical protein